MTDDTVPLRDFVALQIEALRTEHRLKAEAAKAALELQAAEYERRLAELNHAHALAQEVLHTYALLKDFSALKERVDQELTTRTARLSGLTLLISTAGGIAILLGVTISILNYLK